MNQTTTTVLLVRPANFGFNEETAASNAFQKKKNFDQKQILDEFDCFAEKLKQKGVNVIVIEDTKNPVKTDAIFPNNWISFHSDGTIVLYPMLSETRRHERRADIIEKLRKDFEIKQILDLSKHEAENKFLEGTGSIVFDHAARTAYACISPRTDKAVFENLCETLEYKPVSFTATDENGQEIYHTNVMMCVGKTFAVVCLESIEDETERKTIVETLENAGKQIVEITRKQMNDFAGNMLAVSTRENKDLLVLSERAFDSLNENQKSQLEKHAELLPLSIPTIEEIGGGSARCMIAEVFLPPRR